MQVPWMVTDSMAFTVTGRSSEGVAGPARLGLKDGGTLKVRGWSSQVEAAKEGGESGSPRAYNARWQVLSAVWAAGGVQSCHFLSYEYVPVLFCFPHLSSLCPHICPLWEELPTRPRFTDRPSLTSSSETVTLLPPFLSATPSSATLFCFSL